MNKYFNTLFLILFSLASIHLFAQPSTDSIIENKQETTWKGFKRYSFKFNQRIARLIVPNNPLPNNPWIWRARFPDWHTEADSILVAEGFHLAYINTNNQFGSPKAIDVWDDFYTFLITKYQLQKKVALMGVSRGGLFIYNWAKKNPDRVACIYAEAAVCDFKSWPGGFGKSEGNLGSWNKLKKEYGFVSDEEAKLYTNNPIDNLASLAEAKIPILHMIGLKDEVVPVDENTFPLINNYIKLGGSVRVIPCTKGKQTSKGHHFPIETPRVVADFIKYNTLSNLPSNTTEIYVSPSGDDSNSGTQEMPVRTIEKAFDKAKTINKTTTKPITINLQKGDYRLSKPLLITPQLNDLSIVGEGVDKVSIKGSKILKTNWKNYKKNIWVTTVPVDIDFNQLFVNDEKQIIARYPNFDEDGGYWHGFAADAISQERVSKWENPTGGFVHAMHKGRWGGFHYEITGVDKNGELKLIGGHQNNRPSPMHPKFRMVENILEELDGEKEWYFDKTKRKLYLWAEDEIDLNTALVEVTTLKHLIELEGTPERPVKNVKIEGIHFEHSKRTFMEAYQRLLRSDWTIYRGGAILFNGTESCAINNCEFSNLGGNVIFINGYNRQTEIVGNHIHNCGASAISFVGDSTAVRSPSFTYKDFIPFEKMDTISGPANELYPAECSAKDNLIYEIGRVEKQVAGVQISMAMKIHVAHNSIYDVPRAGINVSEGTWGGHIIEYNDVFNTVEETGDHGAFNSWGRDRFWYPKRKISAQLVTNNPQMPYWDAMHTTIIRNNRFRCDHGWDIDLDDGSSNYEIYNNLCLNGGIKLREGFYRVVENNIMVNNGFHPHVWFENSEDVFRKNIMMTKYADIRLKGWGREIDFNLFPDATSLTIAHKNNTDPNSLYGNPMFTNPEKGDFKVKADSPALKLGFKNFSMNRFGVQKTELKAIAKQPEISVLNFYSLIENKETTKKWLGGTIKNIETKEEQSSLGLFSMHGALILKVNKGSKLALAGIKQGDVIIGIEKEKVKNPSDLISKYQAVLWHEQVKLKVVRFQKEMEIFIK